MKKSLEIVDEKCRCGHLRSEHISEHIEDSLARGLGSCTKCGCLRFTWKSNILEEE